MVGPSGVVVATPYIKKSNGADLRAGEIIANQIVTVMYNEAQSRFELVSSASTPIARGVQVSTTNTLSLGQLVYVPNPAWTSAIQTDSYWTSGNLITIPAGLGGKYFVKANILITSIPVSCVVALNLYVGAASQIIASEQRYIPVSEGAYTYVNCSGVVTVVPGNTISFDVMQSSNVSGITTVAAATAMQAYLIGS